MNDRDIQPPLVSESVIERYLSYYNDARDATPSKLVSFTISDLQAFVSRDISALKEYAASRAKAGLDVYLHTSLHDLPDGLLDNTRGSIESAAAAIGLLCDIDAIGPGRKKPPSTLCPTPEAAIGIVEEFNAVFAPLATGLIIPSGFGCYPALLLKEPLMLADASVKLQFEELIQRYHLALHRIAARHGWTGAVEYCDLSKVLRLPGCVNWKDPLHPKRVEITNESPARFTLYDLNELLPPLEKRTIANGVDASAPEARIVLNLKAQISDDLLAALGQAHRLFDDTWNHRRTDFNDPSCSTYDLSLANAGVACGLRDQQIADLLVINRRRFPGNKKKRHGTAYLKYLSGRIALARAGKTTSAEAERQWDQTEGLLSGEGRSPLQTESPAQPGNPDREDGGPVRPDLDAALSTEYCANDFPHGAEAQATQTADSPTQRSGEDVEGTSEQTTESVSDAGVHGEPGLDPPTAGAAEGGHTEPDPNQGNEHRAESDVESIESLLTKLRVAADASLLYQNIDLVARLSDTELPPVFLKLKDIFGRKLNMADLRKAIREARRRQRNADNDAANQRRLSGHPYRISHGGMVRIVEKKDGTEIVPLANFVAAIKEDITEDDGVETKRFFQIAATQGNKAYSFVIAAGELALMEWPIKHIGPSAIVNPNQKDWTRAAVQSLSTNIQERMIYTHTGWRKVGGSVLYLHAAGAIGAAGAAPNIEVHLAGPLAHFELQLTSSKQELIVAIRASLRMIALAKAETQYITFVLLAAAYRACLRGCDFSIWIAGPTGVFKTEVAALAQQHFGAAMSSRRLPGSFSSTANSLEVLAFGAKDTLLVIDDFAPHGNMHDVARYHATADRILRAAGNSQGRGRLSSDARLREAKPPRGLIVVTGEDLPKGQSIRGRTFMMEIAQGDIDSAALTKCQADAASGLYAQSMAGFIHHIAAKYDLVLAEYARLFAQLREKATKAHARTPGIVADLYLGFKLFLDFAVDVGAITQIEREDFAKRCWTALEKVARAQRAQQVAGEPAHRFLELLRAAISAGDAHVAGLNGGEPSDPAKWGWRTIGAGDNERWAGASSCIGWLDGANLYLEPTASYVVAQEVGRGAGEPLVVSETTLRKRLHEAGLLASIDQVRQTLKVRKTVQGRVTEVLHLRASALTEPTPQSANRAVGTEEFRC